MINKKYIFILLIIIQVFILGNIVYAVEPPQRPDNFAAELPVYVSSANENRISLSWNASINADFYVLQITTDTNWAGQTISEQKRITGLSYTDIRQNSSSNPTSGTVFRYKLFAATYIRDALGEPTTEYVPSTNYAGLSVLTDVQAVATALSTSEIKLVWDDIKCNDISIDYEIVKFKKGVNVGQEQIKASEIGQSAIRNNGKLEYTIRNLDKSTEYSFQIYPQVDSNIRCNEYITVAGATHISALMQRYNENIVKLIWDEYQGSIPASDLYYRVIEITTVNGQKSYQTIATPEVPYYFAQISSGQDRAFLIEVRSKEDDSKVAESSEMSLMDMVVPAVPTVSALEITPSNTGMVVEWNVHRTINNDRDSQMKYDLWLVMDPDNVDDIRAYYSQNNSNITDRRAASNLQIADGVSSNTNFSLATVNGVQKYRYNITGLVPNTIYYIGVIAKRTYVMQDPENQELIISVSNNSEPVIKAEKTTSGNLEKPVSLIKPLGLNIKTDNQGKAMVAKDSITIEWPVGEIVNNVFTQFYQDDVYFKIGYEEYTSSFDKTKTNDETNVNYNIHTDNVTITREAQSAYATIAGLKSNTAYVFWVKAYRDVQLAATVTKVSEASDPIIVVTLPDYTVPDTKPPVPALTLIDNVYKDKITVQFNSISGITYTIAWGTEDSVAKKLGQKEYTASSSISPDSVVINELAPETIYYFWIMATNDSISSEWSDSAVGATTAVPPPDAPSGFGVKRVLQSGELIPDIGEHYINLQWEKVDGINYILEVSGTEDFSTKNVIEVNAVSEYKLEKINSEDLKSNVRYWIRLYAKDSTTNKTSQYSPYLTIKTKYNYDEYNSSQETETPLSGKIAQELINGTTGTWSVDLSGPRTDRLIEKIKKQDGCDCNIDLSQTSVSGINTREINVSYKLLNELSNTNQNLVVKSNAAEFTFLPQTLIMSDINEYKENPSDDVNIKIKIQDASLPIDTNRLKTLSPVSKIDIFVIGKKEKQLYSFSNPIKLKINYTNTNSDGVIGCYYLKPQSTDWIKLDGQILHSNNKLYLQSLVNGTGRYCIRKQLPDDGQLGSYTYKEEIDQLLSTGLMKSVDSSNIRPTEYISLEDSVKMILDSVKDSYSNDYMEIAKKSGLLSAVYSNTPTKKVTRQEAISMIMRLYEIRTGEWLQDLPISAKYTDRYEIQDPYNIYISNALKMEILIPKGYSIGAKAYATRADMLVYVSRLRDIFNNN